MRTMDQRREAQREILHAANNAETVAAGAVRYASGTASHAETMARSAGTEEALLQALEIQASARRTHWHEGAVSAYVRGIRTLARDLTAGALFWTGEWDAADEARSRISEREARALVQLAAQAADAARRSAKEARDAMFALGAQTAASREAAR